MSGRSNSPLDEVTLCNDGHRPPEARDTVAGQVHGIYSPGQHRNLNVPEKFGIQEEIGPTRLGTGYVATLAVHPDSTTSEGVGDLEVDSAPESLFPQQQPNQSMPGSTLNGKGYSTDMWSLNPGHSQPKNQMSYGDHSETFGRWPSSSAKSLKDMAKGGLCYKGQRDVAECDNCGAAFGDWEEKDDPLQLHYGRSPSCPVVVKLLKEQKEQIRMNQQRKQQSASCSQVVLPPPIPTAASAALAHALAGCGIGNALVGRDFAQSELLVAKGKPMKNRATQTEFHVTDEEGDYELCKKCGCKPAMLTLYPCMHLVACFNCYKGLNGCPFCKRPVTGSAVTYCKFGN